MPRAFVATERTIREHLIQMLEAQCVEAIPLTGDSVIDNISSLEACNIVIVDHSTPGWVMRESDEHGKLVVAYVTLPDGSVTVLVNNQNQFEDLVALLRPISRKLAPVSDEYIQRLAQVMAMFPVRRSCVAQ